MALGSTIRSSNTEVATGRTSTQLSAKRNRIYLTCRSDSCALSCSWKPKASHNQRAAAPGFRYRKTGVIVVTYYHVASGIPPCAPGRLGLRHGKIRPLMLVIPRRGASLDEDSVCVQFSRVGEGAHARCGDLAASVKGLCRSSWPGNIAQGSKRWRSA